MLRVAPDNNTKILCIVSNFTSYCIVKLGKSITFYFEHARFEIHPVTVTGFYCIFRILARNNLGRNFLLPNP
jgi:hypothetical protein